MAHRLEESFEAIASNSVPVWASPQVKESIARLISRVESAGAVRLTASWGSNGTSNEQTIAVAEIDVAVWMVDEEHEIEQVSVTGRLDKVDLRARRFRIRDDVGHDITLEDVVDLDNAAHLIGERVIAHGAAEHVGDRVGRITEPILTPERLPGRVVFAVAFGTAGGRSCSNRRDSRWRVRPRLTSSWRRSALDRSARANASPVILDTDVFSRVFVQSQRDAVGTAWATALTGRTVVIGVQTAVELRAWPRLHELG